MVKLTERSVFLKVTFVEIQRTLPRVIIDHL